ncbi:MAG: tRNA (adenosine(37)-N6)-threonylcarbamoyltransferase complex dimerization subunit type 1 TsaB [Thermomicrobiales bacterium]|nr:tRNA (adenosine(37)-N6)-threonylcarbamoyltransferase complex dimerization subunit type 1 TsaB [Thermomicrobiales bacterium]
MTDTAVLPALLAIDTASAQAGIAVGNERDAATLVWRAGRSHTVDLLDQIHRLLELRGLAAADLAGVVVAKGPGTFTGLRVGMSIAKGFALALDLPLFGVSALEAAALPLLHGSGAVAATIVAGRGRLVWALYERGETGEPRPLAAPRNGVVAELRDEIVARARPVAITGELSEPDEAALADAPEARIVPPLLRARRPEALLALGFARWRRGDADDAAALEPIYLGR